MGLERTISSKIYLSQRLLPDEPGQCQHIDSVLYVLHQDDRLPKRGVTYQIQPRVMETTFPSIINYTMKVFIVCFLLITSSVSSIHLRRGQDLNNTRFVSELTQEHRILSSKNAKFIPLSCNSPRCNRNRSNWRREKYDPSKGTVVIPCGECIGMNYNQPKLVLPHGLDIQGELVFPRGYRLEIETPFIRVQGKLVMRDDSPITGNPNINITLTGADSTATSFVPAGENEMACAGQDSSKSLPCEVGAKSIVVAGGQIDIQGINDQCKTWVPLEDVVTNTTKIAPIEFDRRPDIFDHPNSLCHSDAIIDVNFTADDAMEGWSGNGALYERTSYGSLRVFNRMITGKHGPMMDLLPLRECLKAGQPYLFVARIRLLNPSARLGSPLACSTTGKNCLAVQTRVTFPSGSLGSSIGTEVPENGFVNGQWKEIYFTTHFDEEELVADATFHVLRLVGPEVSVEIEIDSLRFYLPPVKAVPNPADVCGGNMVLNGDASLDDVHPYPLLANRARVEVWTNRRGDNYFRVDQRADDGHGIAYYFGAPGCFVPSAKYRFSLRLRMQSSESVASRVVMRAFLDSGLSTAYVVAVCPESLRSWVTCTADYVVPLGFPAGSIKQLRLSVETIGSPTTPYLCDDISVELLDGVADTLVVPSQGIDGCWDAGAEILITSHTVDMESAQVRRLKTSPVPLSGGLTQLLLDSSILPPISKRDGAFAVEIALLSRNIMLHAAADEKDELMGGHLIVFHTPDVAQTLAGIEIVNFGRQGELGRYPVHFHMCESVTGSVVKKNSVHHSNQRGVVIHGSHNISIIENVAFEILGHTYMTEDGGEMDNVFVKNLGAMTRPVDRLVRSFETDKSSVSTFWISNPVNECEGNVAAGSFANGFWYELQLSVRSPTSLLASSQGMVPRHLPLTLFRDNVAHSNRIHGLRTYPFGLMPPSQAVFHNTNSYKNGRDGIFFHNSLDLAVVGGVLADNEVHADFDLADNIEMHDTTMIGLSKSYRAVIKTQEDVFVHRGNLVGIELHTFLLDQENIGSKVSNVKFEDFSDTFNNKVSAVRVDPDAKEGRFDYWSTFSDMNIEPGLTNVYDFAGALQNGLTDVFVIDLDGKSNPESSGALAATALVDSKEMTAFLNVERCSKNDLGKSLYCPGVCLRTISLSTEQSADTEGMLLRITSTTTGTSFDFEGKFYYAKLQNGNMDIVKNLSMLRRRSFTAALPKGRFTAQFVHEKTGALTWPGSVEMKMDPSGCSPFESIQMGDIEVNEGEPAGCDRDLIRNGDIEAGLSPWLQNRGSIGLSKGVDGSIALTDNGAGPHNAALGQFLDVRCLEEGHVFDAVVSVRLTRGSTVATCIQGKSCPGLYLRFWTSKDNEGSSFDSQDILISNQFVSQSDSNGWERLQGQIRIDSRVASAPSVAVVVERGQTGVTMMLDNIRVVRSLNSCDPIVRNGDFSTGNSSPWQAKGGQLVVETFAGNHALALHQRASSADTILQNLQTGCLVSGERYRIVARMRFRKPDLSLYRCDPTMRKSDLSCPRFRLQSFAGDKVDTRFALTDHGVTSDEWYTMSTHFVATDTDEMATKSILSITEAPDRKSILIDDVLIEKVPIDCGSLLTNGDGELETASFWTTYITNGGGVISLVKESGNQALKLSKRQNAGDGLSQLVDHRCLDEGSKWTFSARMKLLRGTAPVACDPFSTRLDRGCPPVRILGHRNGVKLVESRFSMSNRPNWKANEMNEYQAEILVTPTLASCDTIVVSIRTFNLEWDMVVDDLSLSRSQ